MQPVAFLRDAWKKWERKRLDKRNISASPFNYSLFSRRSQASSDRSPSNTASRTILPKTSQISFEDAAKTILLSPKWASIKRRNSSSTVKERTYSASQSSSPKERDDHALCFHTRFSESPRYNSSPPRLPSLKPLPKLEIMVNESLDDLYNLAGFKSQPSSPKLPSLNFVQKYQTVREVTIRDQIPRITAKTIFPHAELLNTESKHFIDRLRPKPTIPPKQNATSTEKSGNVQDPLSHFPRPPPFVLRKKKVPKPLVLQPVRPSSSPNLLLYSALETPTPPLPRSLRWPSQKAIGRPLTSFSPPPTDPPTTPLPSPPVGKRRDWKLSLPTYSSDKAPKCESRKAVGRPLTSVLPPSTTPPSTPLPTPPIGKRRDWDVSHPAYSWDKLPKCESRISRARTLVETTSIEHHGTPKLYQYEYQANRQCQGPPAAL